MSQVGRLLRMGRGVRYVAHMGTDQAYYWTPEWQENERAADEELARGEGRLFENVADALAWLMDEEQP